MNFVPEFFASEMVLPRLVEWFNGQEEEARHVVSGEMFIIRVKVLENESGEPIFAINTDPAAEDPSRKYIGETVYLWIGPSGQNLTATSNSFFELSKFIQSDGGMMTVIPFNGTIFTAGQVAEIIRRMGYGVNYTYGQDGYSGNTYGLTPDGTVEARSDLESYMAPVITQKFKTVVNGGTEWAAGLTDDGQLYIWGGDNVMAENGPTPTLVDVGGNPIKQIAALYKSVVMIMEDGTLRLFGSANNTPESWDWEPSYFFNQPKLSEITTPAVDIRGFYQIIPAQGEDEAKMDQWAFITLSDNSVMVWGSRTSYFFSSPAPDNGHYTITDLIGNHSFTGSPIKDVRGCTTGVLVLKEDNTVELFGNDNYTLTSGGEMGFPGSTGIAQIAVTQTGILCLLTIARELWAIDTKSSTPTWSNPSSEGIFLSAGYDHYIMLTNYGTIYSSFFGDFVPVSFDQDPIEVHAGNKWNYALLEDGSLHWWENVGV